MREPPPPLPTNDAAPLAGGAGVKDSDVPPDSINHPTPKGAASSGMPIRPPRRSFLDDALKYRARGWSIIPIRHGKAENKYKRAALKSWKPYQSAPPTEGQIREWFTTSTVDGLAIVLGPVSADTCCRDFDDASAYHEWAETHPDLASTLPTVKTARGYHVYFRCPGCSPAKRSDGEFRAHGQYTLLPPSHHPKGEDYAWIIPLPIGELPTVDPVSAGLLSVTNADEKSEDSERLGRQGRQSVVTVTPAVPVNPVVPVSSALDTDIDRVIRETLPTGPHQHDHCNMTLARSLKLTLGLTIDQSRPYFQSWFAQARIVTSEQDEDSAWFKFRRAWDIAHTPVGTKPADDAFALARRKSIPPEIEARYANPKIRLLLSAMAEMGKHSCGRPFALSCHQIARLLEVTPARAHEWLRGLEGDGVIRCTDRGKSGHPGKNAARYLYLIPDEWGDV